MTPEELGNIRQEFRPGLENLIAGIIIGLLAILGGCVAIYFSINGVIENKGSLPIYAEHGHCWVATVMLTALGIGLIIGGIALIRWIVSLSSHRVRVGANGLSIVDRNITRTFGWDEILGVQETQLHERPPLLKGVAKLILPKMMSQSFQVTVKNAQPFAFDGNSIKGHATLAGMIKEETEPRNIPWEIVVEQGH